MTPTRRAQIAVWIERDGEYLRTLALTQSVAYRGLGNRPGASQMNSGFRWPYGRREGVLPVWAHRRASAPGAEPFRRVVFQDRISEGHASRSSNDFSRDDYFCLSFNRDTTGRDALDAVTCASIFNSDKGRYMTEGDVARGYAEPAERDPGVGMMRPLDLTSLYPPRRDATACTTGVGCYDHPDVVRFAADARRVMPEIDAVTRATSPGGQRMLVAYTLPTDWPSGDYVVWVEVNTEGDYNAAWNDQRFPTPQNPAGTWDYWAVTYGYPYRGQPSVVYSLPIRIEGATSQATAGQPSGYGSLSGQGATGGEMSAMDGTISDSPETEPGSGADRLLSATDGWRVRVTVVGAEVCSTNTPPAPIEALAIREYEERRNAHRYAHLSFRAPADDLGVDRYEVRVSHEPITDAQSFERALPAQAATLEIEGLMVPTGSAAGTTVEVDFGGLAPETHYWVAIRALDRCNEASPIAVAEHTTPAIQFTTVSPCFVATAAYGSPMAGEIGSLRRLRDRHLRTNAPGRALVALYEEVGPHLADQIRDDEVLRAGVRTALAPLVALARWLD